MGTDDIAGKWMESEIVSQASLLRANASSYYETALAGLAGKEFELAVLAARGSSDNAALYARYLIEIHLGIPVVLAAPSVVTLYGKRTRYPKCLAIGISQSGAAPDVSEVLRALREDGHTTLAITNAPGSRITEEAEFSLDLRVGAEHSVAATKTYSASLLALYQIVRAIGRQLPDPSDMLPADGWIESSRQAAERASGAVVRCHPLFAIGRGYSFSTACESAIKLMECALLPCKAYSGADFRHGPMALAGPGSAVIDYTGVLSASLAQPTEFVVAQQLPEGIPTELSPIWHIPFGQWLALLAARARGLDPDRPQYIQKVTETV